MDESLEEMLKTRLSMKKMITKINDDPQNFSEALRIALTEDKPQAWRAAWLLNHCIKKNDERIRCNIERVINSVRDKEDGHQRELLKILDKMKIIEDHEGYLFDECMNIWEAIEKSPSVRITAFGILLKIVKKYPELKSEIEHLIQSHYTETLSPGIKRSFHKNLKDLGIE